MTDEQIFQNAIALPAESREQYLSEACADNNQRQRMAALLAAQLLDSEFGENLPFRETHRHPMTHCQAKAIPTPGAMQ